MPQGLSILFVCFSAACFVALLSSSGDSFRSTHSATTVCVDSVSAARHKAAAAPSAAPTATSEIADLPERTADRLYLRSDPLFCFVDTETTGVDTNHARVIELAATFDPAQLEADGIDAVVGADATAQFQRLVRPDVRIPPRSTAVHGLHDADVAQADEFGHVIQEFSQWLDAWHQATGRDILLVAHNAKYDASVLDAEMMRHTDLGLASALHPRTRWACSLAAIRRTVRARDAGLAALVRDFLPAQYDHTAHRALGDCKALIDVMHAIPHSPQLVEDLVAQRFEPLRKESSIQADGNQAQNHESNDDNKRPARRSSRSASTNKRAHL